MIVSVGIGLVPIFSLNFLPEHIKNNRLSAQTEETKKY